MKTCDEMVNSLFQRREQYLAEQKMKRRNAIISAALYCCAFAVIGGIVLNIKSNIVSKQQSETSSDITSIVSTAESADTSAPKLPTADNIVWYEGYGYDDDSYTIFGNKQINSSLGDIADDSDHIFAVTASRFVDTQFVYNGKTIAQYEAEEELQKRKVDTLNNLINSKDYLSLMPYDTIIAEIGEDNMSEYVVNGVLMEDKAMQDFKKAVEDWGTAQRTWDKACEAYRAYIYEKTAAKLEAQGIKTAYSSDPAYLLLFVSREDFANLTLENMSEWFFMLASKDIYPKEYEIYGGQSRIR